MRRYLVLVYISRNHIGFAITLRQKIISLFKEITFTLRMRRLKILRNGNNPIAHYFDICPFLTLYFASSLADKIHLRQFPCRPQIIILGRPGTVYIFIAAFHISAPFVMVTHMTNGRYCKLLNVCHYNHLPRCYNNTIAKRCQTMV